MTMLSRKDDGGNGRWSVFKKDEGLLHSKYFCQITNGKVESLGDPTMMAVMELAASEVKPKTRVPFRYVLVIDVSSSMGFEVGDGPDTLLDRVKVFAELFIKVVSRKDSISIITFSDDAEIEFPMTEMNDWSKDNAKTVIKNLCPKQNTNLESGLMTGLDVLANNPCEESRDCIILFTDGETNTGEEEADVLVKKFKTAHDKLNKQSSVPLSAFTIGQYMPVLLTELADSLGSESFYWLSEEEDFESDMLLPIFLREVTQVTDVSIELSCLSNFTFDVDSILLKHLKKSSLTKIEYFVHALPGGIVKHIPLTVIPPEGDLQTFHKKPVVKVTISYNDLSSTRREITENIVFSYESLKTCRTKRIKEKGVTYSDASDGVSAYTVEKNNVDLSWTAAQEALIKVVREDCRMLTIGELDNSLYLILEEGNQMPINSFDEAIEGIEEIKNSYRGIFGHRNKCTAMISECADEWKAQIEFGKSIANPYNYGRIAALHSSISSEMPVSKGVHRQSHRQQYMPRQVRKKMRKYENIVRRKAKTKVSSDNLSVFASKTILVSESLRTKLYGIKQETMGDLIAKHGGRPEYYVIVSPYKSNPGWYVDKAFRNTVLVCSAYDHENNSLSVRAAKRAHVPIVREQFVLDCVKRKKYLKIEGYFFNCAMT